MSTEGWSIVSLAGRQTVATAQMLSLSIPDREREERALVQALRDGDERAFVALVGRYHPMLVRMACLYVAERAAEDLAQDVWCSALRQIDLLDAGVSLRVALLTFVHEQARHRLPGAATHIPYAAYWDPASDPIAPGVDPTRFRTGEPWPGHWAAPVAEWEPMPVERLLARPTSARIEAEIAELPPAQREVLVLRDVERWISSEVCAVLGISEATQRLLLHGARSRMRAALDDIIREA